MTSSERERGLIDTARRLGAATLHEAAGKTGALPSRIKPLCPHWKIAGLAFPVVGPARDNLWLHRAIYAAPAGTVLLHECGGFAEAGYWGGIMANAAMAMGLAGFVTEGGIRDTSELIELGFPTFAANFCITGTTKRTDGAGSLGASASLGGILVRSGDLIVGDADGIVVIAHDKISTVIAAGLARESEEREIVERIKRGERTLEIYHL